jgi:hypothetical protein
MDTRELECGCAPDHLRATRKKGNEADYRLVICLNCISSALVHSEWKMRDSCHVDLTCDSGTGAGGHHSVQALVDFFWISSDSTLDRPGNIPETGPGLIQFQSCSNSANSDRAGEFSGPWLHFMPDPQKADVSRQPGKINMEYGLCSDCAVECELKWNHHIHKLGLGMDTQGNCVVNISKCVICTGYSENHRFSRYIPFDDRFTPGSHFAIWWPPSESDSPTRIDDGRMERPP